MEQRAWSKGRGAEGWKHEWWKVLAINPTASALDFARGDRLAFNNRANKKRLPNGQPFF